LGEQEQAELSADYGNEDAEGEGVEPIVSKDGSVRYPLADLVIGGAEPFLWFDGSELMVIDLFLEVVSGEVGEGFEGIAGWAFAVIWYLHFLAVRVMVKRDDLKQGLNVFSVEAGETFDEG